MTQSRGLTVVIPTIGRWHTLRRCIDALGRQDLTGVVQVICVVNGEVDIPDLAPRHDWLRYVQEPRRSVGQARNAGLIAAESPWIAFTDDDCIVPTSWIRNLIEYIERNPDIHIAGGAVVEPDRDGSLYRFMRDLNYMRNVRTLKKRAKGIPSFGAANMLVRRSSLEEVGG